MIAANNGLCLVFENLSKIPVWLSDALCRISTGGGLSTRRLYENDEETILAATCPIILNGIEYFAERQDLVDRAVIVNLHPIPDADRKRREQLQRDFEEARPRLLGALYSAVSLALRESPNVRLEDYPRMADFAIWATAAQNAFGEDADFLLVYRANRMKANELALRASEVAKSVEEWFEKLEFNETKISLKDLLKQLTENLPKRGKSNLPDRPEGFPQTEKTLAGELRRCAPNLRRFGIHVGEIKRSGAHGENEVSFKRLETNLPINHGNSASVHSVASDNPTLSECTECTEAASNGKRNSPPTKRRARMPNTHEKRLSNRAQSSR